MSKLTIGTYKWMQRNFEGAEFSTKKEFVRSYVERSSHKGDSLFARVQRGLDTLDGRILTYFLAETEDGMLKFNLEHYALWKNNYK
ncbi:MAG: hypothetical protein MAG795_00341 [Candidatus Woesearchaeota archaeon]|nr:hypothetical protein [Candidatus Woesearchaeota archaeon]